jgi:hypothetical protein
MRLRRNFLFLLMLPRYRLSLLEERGDDIPALDSLTSKSSLLFFVVDAEMSHADHCASDRGVWSNTVLTLLTVLYSSSEKKKKKVSTVSRAENIGSI